MHRRTSRFARSKAALGFPIGLLTLAACTPTPTGPTMLWITASGLPAAPPGVPVTRGPYGLIGDIATALTGDPVAPLPGEPGDILVPGEKDTLCELVSRYGLETAAFVTDDGLREEFGFLQGVLHSSDLPMLMAEASDGPLRGAISAAYGLLEQKIPRPMEDGAFVWLHLDLELIPDPSVRPSFLEETVRHFEDLLARRPDSALVQVSFGPDGVYGGLVVRSPWFEASTTSVAVTELRGIVIEAMGHRLEGNTTIRVGEPREILLPAASPNSESE